MKYLQSLLISKLNCAKNFSQLAQDLLSVVESKELNKIELIQLKRNKLLHAMQLFDQKIKEHVLKEKLSGQNFDQIIINFYQSYERELKKIQELDVQSMQAIELQTKELNRSILETDSGHKTISKFKSHSGLIAGEQLDRTI